MSTQPSVFITQFQLAEVAHAIHQQVFRKAISLVEAKIAYAHFERDCDDGLWHLVAQPEKAFERCAGLGLSYAATLGIRSLDSLHVAAALELKADRFWTFDERQARLAEAEGLTTT